MSDRPDANELSRRLGEPFPPAAHKQRSVGGKGFVYVEGHVVIHRLIDATNNVWDFRVLDINTSVVGKDQTTNDILLVRATVELTIPGLGTRQHIGVQTVRAGSGEDLAKGAITDGLKKAATLFGVGLELYGPDYESGEIEEPRPRHVPTEPSRVPSQGGAKRDLVAESNPNHPSNTAHRALTSNPEDVNERIDYAVGMMRSHGLDEAVELKPFGVSDIGALSPVLLTKLIERVEKRVGPANLPGMPAAVAAAGDDQHTQ